MSLAQLERLLFRDIPAIWSRLRGDITTVKPTLPTVANAPDIGLVRGQEDAKTALMVCVAGRHNLLLIGPPGEGKSFLCSTIPTFSTQLTVSEWEETAKLYKQVGVDYFRDDQRTKPLRIRPYRTIGPTITQTSLIGGGRSKPQPGEISLAHNGTLFIDELPQFSRPLLDSLRQPLESGSVTISRGGKSTSFPARFSFIAAMNPCPCGYYRSIRCRCSFDSVKRYANKISGPILDRIDAAVWVSRLDSEDRFAETIPNQSQHFLYKVTQATLAQFKRNGFGVYNSSLGPAKIFDSPCGTNGIRFSPEGLNWFRAETSKPRYGTRGAIRLARLSRTVADLYNSLFVESLHISTAVSLCDSQYLEPEDFHYVG